MTQLSDQLQHHKEHPRLVPIGKLFTSLLQMHFCSQDQLQLSVFIKLSKDQIHCDYTTLDSHSQDRRAVET